MGRETGIAWTHSTWNPWRGCEQISPGCKHCYAKTLSKRNHALLGQWGPPAAGGTRIIASPAMWREPLKWNAAAKASGQPHRVFCSSLADVFEDLDELRHPRQWLWALINATPNLTWLLLTKRPMNIRKLTPQSWVRGGGPIWPWSRPWSMWPSNVWIGTTVEDTKRAHERLEWMAEISAPVRFVSVEPQLEHVDLSDYLGGVVDWVIQGGESGPHARPFDLTWADSMRAQCAEAGVAYFFKQMGSSNTGRANDPGADPARWPDRFRVQQFPEVR